MVTVVGMQVVTQVQVVIVQVAIAVHILHFSQLGQPVEVNQAHLHLQILQNVMIIQNGINLQQHVVNNIEILYNILNAVFV